MSTKILMRRGIKADLPELAEGEFGFCTDTKELFIGSVNGNVLLTNQSIIEKLSAEAVKSINDIPPDENGNVTIELTGDGNVNYSEAYKLEPIGELFSPPERYNAWCPSNLRFDSTRNVFACLINGANQHVFSTMTQYFCTINPDTLISSKPKAISVSDTNGNPVTFDVTSANNFIILINGTYMYFMRKNGVYHRVTSVDGGMKWIDQGQITATPSIGSNYNIWGITKLSNGRLICGFGAALETRAKIMYSDNDGINWTIITIGKSFPLGTTSAEPCIIEVAPNKLISLARKSTSGMSYGTVGGPLDPALIAFSTDNGENWTDYIDSNSILKMNASNATAVVHDGIVEVLSASRLYTTIDNENTGQTGVIHHYTATIENALNDNFTLKETILYAKAENSVDFHSPCISIDDKNRALLMYMDASKIQSTVNYNFARGSLGYISYQNQDHSSSPVFGYTGKYIDNLISNLMTEINSLKYSISQIPGSDVIPPTGNLLWTKQYNAQNENVTIDKSTAFGGKINTNTSPGYNSLETDLNNIKYNKLGDSFGIAITTSKPNFAISYKGTISNQLKAPITAAIIGGVGYGIISVNSFFNISDSNSVVHEYKFEYWNGIMKAFIDGVDVSSKVITFTFDSTNVIPYMSLMNVIGTIDSAKNYVISAAGRGGKIYEVKFGEWNS